MFGFRNCKDLYSLEFLKYCGLQFLKHINYTYSAHMKVKSSLDFKCKSCLKLAKNKRKLSSFYPAKNEKLSEFYLAHNFSQTTQL